MQQPIRWSAWILLTLLSWAASASAQSPESGSAAESDTQAAGPSDSWDQGRTISATRESSARALDGDQPGDSKWLIVPRAILFLPRMVLRYVVLLPFEKLAYFIGRLQGNAKFRLILLSFYRTGFRPNIGLGVVGSRYVNEDRGFAVGASYAGVDFQFYEARYKLHLPGQRRLEFQGRYRRQGDRAFFGVGPDTLDQRSRYFLEEIRAEAKVKQNWTAALQTSVQTGYHRFRTRDTTHLEDEDTTISDRFASGEVVGFGDSQSYWLTGVDNSLKLGRERSGKGVGFLADAHLEAWWALGEENFSTVTGGSELVLTVPLFHERTIAVRALAEAAGEVGDDVPFYFLPRAGSGSVLRGFVSGRFQDRVLTAGSFEYRWPITNQADAFGFFDFGRVFPSFSDFTFSDWKWGAGGGLRFHSRNQPLFSLQLAYSDERIEFLLLTGSDLF